MRTMIAPLDREVEADLDALDPWLRKIARGCIGRLAVEPYLGSRVPQGLLAARQGRRVYFDRDDRPGRVLDYRRSSIRRGDQLAATGGPRFRVVYLVREAQLAEVRLVVVLAVGAAHTAGRDVYGRAAERVLRIERRRR